MILCLVLAACHHSPSETATHPVLPTHELADPPWRVDEVPTEPKPEKKPAAVAKLALDGGVDAGAKAVVAAALADAGAPKLVVAEPPKSECVTLCEEARKCIEALMKKPIDCVAECAKNEPGAAQALQKAAKCRGELAKSCDAWMMCLYQQGSEEAPLR